MSAEPMPPADASEPRYGPGSVRLVDGPYDGKYISAFIVRSQLRCAEGVYLHVEGGEPMELYWIEYPIVVEDTGTPAVRRPHRT